MKRALILTAVLVGAGMGVVVPAKVECQFCGSAPCYSRHSCFPGCTCLRTDYGAGQCVSLEAAGDQ